MDRLAASYINLARVMLILDLWSDGEYRSGINILRTLDRRSTRSFQRDLIDRLRPWMYWLEIPFAVSSVGVDFVLNALNLPGIAEGAIVWSIGVATPFVVLANLMGLWYARLRRIPIERRFNATSFNRALLIASISGYGLAAVFGAIGSVVLPEIFIPWHQ